jgi:hypothetical protein
MRTIGGVFKVLSQVAGVVFLGMSAAMYFISPGNAEIANLGPVLVHVVNPISGDPILPQTNPLPGSPSTTIKVVACRDEYEPASFVMRSLGHDIENLRFTVSDLVDDGKTISHSYIDLRFVKVWFQAGGGWNHIGLSQSGKKKVLVPELLLKDDGLVQLNEKSMDNLLRLQFSSGPKLISISEPASSHARIVASTDEFPIHDAVEIQPITLHAGEAKQLWITIHVPSDAKDGNYKGSITLTDDKGLLGKMDLTLQVLPVDLHAPRIQYSVYYRGTLSETPSISSERKDQTQFLAESSNMFAHGVKNPTVYHRLDRAELRRTFEIRKQVGLDMSTIFYLGTGTGNSVTHEELNGLKRRLRGIKEIAGEHRIDTVYLYGIDEAKGERLASQRKAWQTVRNEGVKVFTAGSAEVIPAAGDVLDLLVMAGKLQKEKAESVHASGHKIFSYANPQTGPENPEIFRRNYGLELWRNGYDGAMPYAYQDSMGFIWNDFDHHQFRDHNFTYPTVDGVIDTLAWEGFREAIDDVRYITTLEDMLETTPKPYTPAAMEAQHYLEELRGALPSNLVDVRSKIVQHILRLSS